MIDKNAIDRAALYARLKRPEGPVDVVLDTDTCNEIDDQFALAYLILSDDKLNLKGVFAAPCINDKCATVEEGMEKSYEEILKVLRIMNREDLNDIVYRGSTEFLPSEEVPVVSEAAEKLIEISKDYTSEKPLYVAAIGAITNIASAILMDPTIVERIYVIWLGAHMKDIGHNLEYNLMQDVASGRVVVQSGVPLVLMPAQGGTSHLVTTKPELVYWLKDRNPLCDFLLENTVTYCEDESKGRVPRTWSKVIWDIAAIAWLLDGDFVSDRIITAPLFTYDHHSSDDPDGLPIRYVYQLFREPIYEDLFTKLIGHQLDRRQWHCDT